MFRGAGCDSTLLNHTVSSIQNPEVRRFWGPYAVDLSGSIRKGANRLEVVVTNTLANAIADPQVLRHWRANCQPLSPYEDKQRTFEKESLASRLIGPVKIRFGRNS